MKYDDFKKKVLNLPEWVKTEEDNLLYIRHLQFKLLKYEALLDWFYEWEPKLNNMERSSDDLYNKLKKELSYTQDMEDKIDPEGQIMVSLRFE